mmetsp:Transcript_12269/g.36450  ORF Transcript_12269/g.36450 Transcript_12269/m.36450 type:complete len:269 (+) Transcript_12269:4584-5390(+)
MSTSSNASLPSVRMQRLPSAGPTARGWKRTEKVRCSFLLSATVGGHARVKWTEGFRISTRTVAGSWPSLRSAMRTSCDLPRVSLPICSSPPLSEKSRGPWSETDGTAPSPRSSKERKFVWGSEPAGTDASKMAAKFPSCGGTNVTWICCESCGPMVSFFGSTSKGSGSPGLASPRAFMLTVTSQGMALGFERRSISVTPELICTLRPPACARTGPKWKMWAASAKTRTSGRPAIATASSSVRVTNCSSKIVCTSVQLMPGMQLWPLSR